MQKIFLFWIGIIFISCTTQQSKKEGSGEDTTRYRLSVSNGSEVLVWNDLIDTYQFHFLQHFQLDTVYREDSLYITGRYRTIQPNFPVDSIDFKVQQFVDQCFLDSTWLVNDILYGKMLVKNDASEALQFRYNFPEESNKQHTFLLSVLKQQ